MHRGLRIRGHHPSALARVFPATVRSTGTSFSYNIAAIFFAGFTPALMTWAVQLSSLATLAVLAGLVALATRPAFLRRIAKQETESAVVTRSGLSKIQGVSPSPVGRTRRLASGVVEHFMDRGGKFDGIRQWIESVFDSLKDQLCLEHHGARILDGLYARVASKFPVLAAGIWHNWKTYEPRKRSLNAYDP